MAVSRGQQLVAVTWLLFAVTLYQLCPQFPDTASKPWFKKAVCTFVNFVELLGSIGDSIGLPSRRLTRFLSQSVVYPLPGTSNITENTTQLAGVPVIINRPKISGLDALPAIVYFHAGGWTLLNAGFVTPVTRLLAEHAQAIVISVNYRKAPEHIFPAAFDDCLAVTQYVLRHGADLGIDPSKVGVKGDSAGGNLALAVALYLSNKTLHQEPPLRLVSLDNPALQALDFNLPSYIKHEEGPCFLNKRVMLRFWLNYAFGDYLYYDQFYVNNHTALLSTLPRYSDYVSHSLLPQWIRQEGTLTGKPAEKEDKNEQLSEHVKDLIVNPYFAPLMATDDMLKHLPPVYIMAVEFDVLRDDSFLLAERLRKLGNDVQFSFYQAEMHAFVSFASADHNAFAEILKFSEYYKKAISAE